MIWHRSNRFDPRATTLANRHYSRQSHESPQFVAPGRNIVLLTEHADALWVSLWQRPEFIKHAWKECWNNSLFRNESPHLSSSMINEAVAYTFAVWGTPPSQGFISFIDQDKTRKKRDPGRCYLRAGWERVGATGSGLIAMQLPPDRFPAATAIPMQTDIFTEVKP